MATSQQFLNQDNGNATNFKAWAQPLSNQIRTFGWTNSSDTGQLNGAGAGNWAGVSTVPGTNAYYYEIFKPGDALTTFYLKLEYGNGGAANCPGIRVSIGTSTDGAGNLTGFVTTVVACIVNSTFTPSTTPFECNFSGDSGRLCMMMWRNGPGPQIFCVQRSLNASGTVTGTYVTLWTAGFTGGSNTSGTQQSIHFTSGVAPLFGNVTTSGSNQTAIPMVCPNFAGAAGGTSAFAGSIPVTFAQPCVGIWDYPCTAVGGAYKGDISEGAVFTITNQYGQSKTYMPTKTVVGINVAIQGGQTAFCMEYD